ncbi:hypothetical protein [Sutcliffiella halmapala]|uniref:hypothetical protein n=1 Tax=Sutcliffiella halmapala TaxID=79882 RepID=UPI0009952E52|nr:hypothetical protein [Sutcliffiella halmapala]
MYKFVFILLSVYILNPIYVYGSEFKVSDTCLEVSQKFREYYINEIKQDLIKSFNFDTTKYTEYNSHDDIEKLYHDLGKYDTRISSLTDKLVGEYYGVKFVFINKEQNGGYIIFKNKHGNNIMEKVNRTSRKWIKVDVEEIKSIPPYQFDYRGFFCL